MRQLDRRRALIPGGSDWDFEFYASRGVLPPSNKMYTMIFNPSAASQSTSGFENGYYRLRGVSSSGEGGMTIRLTTPFLAAKCEAECAFYIRSFSINELAFQINLRDSAGHDFIVRVQSGRVAVLGQKGSTINKQYYSRTSYTNTRYVIRCDLDSVNSVAHIWLNDVLIATKTSNFVMDSYACTCQIMAISGGSNVSATVDIEYLKYRKL